MLGKNISRRQTQVIDRVKNMNIALPVLLLVFGGLTFWVLNESSLKWYFKTASISAFCVFTVIFWSAIHTFLGWPALENDMPEKVVLHWVIIKEPNKLTKSNGRIYVLLESADAPRSNFLAKFFGYKKEKVAAGGTKKQLDWTRERVRKHLADTLGM